MAVDLVTRIRRLEQDFEYLDNVQRALEKQVRRLRVQTDDPTLTTADRNIERQDRHDREQQEQVNADNPVFQKLGFTRG